jgi:hypothetical protein
MDVRKEELKNGTAKHAKYSKVKMSRRLAREDARPAI